MRYLQDLPPKILKGNIIKISGKKALKVWLKENIPKDGDMIFRGNSKSRIKKNIPQALG